MKQLARRYCTWSGIDRAMEYLTKYCENCASIKLSPSEAPINPSGCWSIPRKHLLILVDAKSRWLKFGFHIIYLKVLKQSNSSKMCLQDMAYPEPYSLAMLPHFPKVVGTRTSTNQRSGWRTCIYNQQLFRRHERGIDNALSEMAENYSHMRIKHSMKSSKSLQDLLVFGHLSILYQQSTNVAYWKSNAGKFDYLHFLIKLDTG